MIEIYSERASNPSRCGSLKIKYADIAFNYQVNYDLFSLTLCLTILLESREHFYHKVQQVIISIHSAIIKCIISFGFILYSREMVEVINTS